MRHSISHSKVILNDKNLLRYKKNPNMDLIIVEDESEIVRLIYNLFLQGYGYRKTENILKIIILNPLWEKMHGAHQQLIEYFQMKNMQDM